jgi:hypothetical protein
MARPPVAEEGDGLQMWRVATNIMNKQSWTTNKGWSSSLGAWCGTDDSSPPQKNYFLRNVTQGLGRSKWEDNIKMDLREIGWGECTGFIWLRMGIISAR